MMKIIIMMASLCWAAAKAAEAAVRSNEDEMMHIMYARTYAMRLLAFLRLVMLVVVLRSCCCC